jgi:Tol biopolymer transport system component
LVWFDRRGQPGSTVGAPTDASTVRISPDRKQIAFVDDGIWIQDLTRNVRTQFITGPAGNPVWSPDGSRLIVGSGAGLVRAIYEKPSNGASPARLVLPPDQGISVFPLDWSRDERFVVFAKNMPGTIRDLWVLPRFDERAPYPYLVTPHDEPHAALSPDGRWLAYASGESETYQIVIQPFSDPAAGKWQISTAGGVCPRWSSDGRELYYLDANSRIVAASLKTGTTFDVGQTTALFETRLAFPIVSAYMPPCPYDVTADGQRFLVSEPVRSIPITVVVNWTSVLERRATTQQLAH